MFVDKFNCEMEQPPSYRAHTSDKPPRVIETNL